MSHHTHQHHHSHAHPHHSHARHSTQTSLISDTNSSDLQPTPPQRYASLFSVQHQTSEEDCDDEEDKIDQFLALHPATSLASSSSRPSSKPPILRTVSTLAKEDEYHRAFLQEMYHIPPKSIVEMRKQESNMQEVRRRRKAPGQCATLDMTGLQERDYAHNPFILSTTAESNSKSSSHRPGSAAATVRNASSTASTPTPGSKGFVPRVALLAAERTKGRSTRPVSAAAASPQATQSQNTPQKQEHRPKSAVRYQNQVSPRRVAFTQTQPTSTAYPPQHLRVPSSTASVYSISSTPNTPLAHRAAVSTQQSFMHQQRPYTACPPSRTVTHDQQQQQYHRQQQPLTTFTSNHTPRPPAVPTASTSEGKEVDVEEAEIEPQHEEQVFKIRRRGSDEGEEEKEKQEVVSDENLHHRKDSSPLPSTTRLLLLPPSSASQHLITHYEPFHHQAHALICSLLHQSMVPHEYEYVQHLMIEQMMQCVEGEASTASAAPSVTFQTSPPQTRLLALGLNLAQLQALSSRFSSSSSSSCCTMLGRRMETQPKCSVMLVHIEPHWQGRTLTQVKEKLMLFLAQIMQPQSKTRQQQRSRAELWSEVDEKKWPKLLTMNNNSRCSNSNRLYYDQAQEIVCRLAELGVRGKVVSLDDNKASNPSSSTASSTNEQYSLHVSNVTRYDPEFVKDLAEVLKERSGSSQQQQNFMLVNGEERPGEEEEEKRIDVYSSPAAATTPSKPTYFLLPARPTSHHSLLTRYPLLHSSIGWDTPESLVNSHLLPLAPKPVQLITRFNLHDQDIRSLPPVLRKRAMRAEVNLIARQQKYLSLQKKRLLKDKKHMNETRVALEKDLVALNEQKVNMMQNLAEEERVLEKRKEEVEMKRVEDETALKQQHDALTQRQEEANQRDVELQGRQSELTNQHEFIEQEKLSVTKELEQIEAELEKISSERNKIHHEESRLAESKQNHATQQESLRKEEEALKTKEAQITEEKLSLESSQTQLEQKAKEMEESHKKAEEERTLLTAEKEEIKKEQEKVSLEKEELAKQHALSQQKLLDESLRLKQEDEHSKSFIQQEQLKLDQKISELHSMENHLVLARKVDEEMSELEEKKKRVDETEANRAKEYEMKMKEGEDRVTQLELTLRAAWTEKIGAEEQAEAQRQQAELERIAEWERKLTEVDLARAEYEKRHAEVEKRKEEEEKERQEKLAAERTEKLKQKRQQRMEGGLKISTSATGGATAGAGGSVDISGSPLPNNSPISPGTPTAAAVNGTIIAAPTALASSPSLSSVAPAIAATPSPTTAAQKNGLASYTAASAASSKKLLLTADDIAGMTPLERKKYETLQADHAEWDEMYRQYLGITAKQMKKNSSTSGTPIPIFLLLELSVTNVERVGLAATTPVIEIHSVRGKTTTLIDETEGGSSHTQSFLPLLLDVFKVCSLQMERLIILKVMQYNSRATEETRVMIGESQMNLIELQCHQGEEIPIINLEKQKKEGKKYTDAGKLCVKRAELYVQSTHGLTHFSSPNIRDPSSPSHEKLTRCIIRFDLRAVGVTMQGGFFGGTSKDVALFVELFRKEHVAAASVTTQDQFSTTPFYKSEVRLGTNCTFTPVRFGFWEACYGDLNRPILCHLNHDASLSSTLITSFEFTLGSLLSVMDDSHSSSPSSVEFPVGPADKKGVKSGKLVIEKAHSCSALTDLQLLCDAAGLTPQPVVKTNENVDLPPLGLDGLMVENQGRIAQAKVNPQPIAFGQWHEPIATSNPSPTHAPVGASNTSGGALPPKPVIVHRKQPTQGGSIGNGTPLGLDSKRSSGGAGHRTSASNATAASIMSQKKK